jgi:hypothetical protein
MALAAAVLSARPKSAFCTAGEDGAAQRAGARRTRPAQAADNHRARFRELVTFVVTTWSLANLAERARHGQAVARATHSTPPTLSNAA